MMIAFLICVLPLVLSRSYERKNPSWLNPDKSPRSAEDRAAFIQGEWDERRRSRGTSFQPRVLSTDQIDNYKKGAAAWRRRGAHTPSTDRRKSQSYVRGTWPAACPSNGMSPDTVAKLLGPGGSGPVALGSE
jgi:hypothetical protein